MKKPNFLKRFTIIDILIIICIIGAVGFAIFHMTADNSDNIASTSFDSSTNNKIMGKYLDYYREGNMIKSKVVGANSTNGEDVEIEGNVLWVGEDENGGVNILLDNNGEKTLAGLYSDVPNADIYYDKISLETTGEKYDNLKEIRISSMELNSLKDLVSKIPKEADYEISAELSVSDMNNLDYQNLLNKLKENKKPVIVTNQLSKIVNINRANKTDISLADSVLGEFDGQTGEITLRIYNCSDDTLKSIQNNYKVTKVIDIS